MGSWSGIFRKQKFKCSLCPGEDSPLIHTARSIDKCFARLREWYLKVLLLQVETDAHVKRQEQTLYCMDTFRIVGTIFFHRIIFFPINA